MIVMARTVPAAPFGDDGVPGGTRRPGPLPYRVAGYRASGTSTRDQSVSEPRWKLG